MKTGPVSAENRLRDALCAGAVGHYRGWSMDIGEAAHMGMDPADPHGEDADAIAPLVKELVSEALRAYRRSYDVARQGRGWRP